MQLQVNFITWIAAVLPIVVLLIMMVKLQIGAVKAAPVGLAVSAVCALVVYRASPLHIAMDMAKGVWSALTILIVVWTAILLYEVANEAKAFLVFRRSMNAFSQNELLQIMLLAWVFTSFLQGITGFGVPVAVGAPLLIGIGMHPFWAVVIPLLCHTWGNTFGTLGAAWDSLAVQGDLLGSAALYTETAFWATLFIWMWNLVCGVMLCWFYGKGEGVRKGLPAVLVISVVQGGGQMLIGQWNTTLACFIPCCLSAAAILLLGRTPLYNKPWRIENSAVMNRDVKAAEDETAPQDMNMVQAFLPYIVLTALTLVILLVGPIKELLGRFSIGFAFPEMVTGSGFVEAGSEKFSPLTLFTHAGMFLLASAVFGYFYFKSKGWITQGKGIWQRTIKKTVPSSISVICFIAMSKVMSGTGQTVVMASGIAAAMGTAYAIFAPVVGTLGSFMTSSNMASNILFGSFQRTTAGLLGLNPALILGAQTAGGAIGSAICPGNIVLGATTAGIMGKEGSVLRKVLPFALTAALIVGLITYAICIAHP